MWMFWLSLLNTFFMLVVAIQEVRRPAKALNWLTICLIFPILGFGIYLSTTHPVGMRRERLTSNHDESDKLPDSFTSSTAVIAQSLHHLTVHGLQAGSVQVLTNGIET